MNDHIKMHLLMTIAFGLAAAVSIIYYINSMPEKVQTYRPDLMCLEKE